MEAYVPPGGGPPPHIHRMEDETFYIVEGRSTSCSATTRSAAGPVTSSTSRGHRAPLPQLGHDRGEDDPHVRPAGIEHFFAETLEQALD
jgi:hypothetical protein